MTRVPGAALVAGLLLGAPAVAVADVVDRAPNGFTLKTTAQVSAPPDRAWQALLDIGSWWGKDHTYSGDSRNMSIDPKVGGCFCERLPDDGGVEHGRVVQLRPGTLLRLTTALGPLQEMGLVGSWTWQLAATGTGSTITMTYAVGGYAAGGVDKLAPIVDQVLSQQVAFLKAFVEQPR